MSSFLSQVDPQALAWSAGVSGVVAVLKILRISQSDVSTHKTLIPGAVAVVGETVIGSLLGGILAPLVAAEISPQLVRPGKMAIICVGGALGLPLLIGWFPQIFKAALEFWIKLKLGFTVAIKDTATPPTPTPADPTPPPAAPPPADPGGKTP